MASWMHTDVPDRHFDLAPPFSAPFKLDYIPLHTTLVECEGRQPKFLTTGRKWLVIPDQLKCAPKGGVNPGLLRHHELLRFT